MYITSRSKKERRDEETGVLTVRIEMISSRIVVKKKNYNSSTAPWKWPAAGKSLSLHITLHARRHNGSWNCKCSSLRHSCESLLFSALSLSRIILTRTNSFYVSLCLSLCYYYYYEYYYRYYYFSAIFTVNSTSSENAQCNKV